jgi:MFS family permease
MEQFIEKKKGKWNILLVILMANFVMLIDSTSMNVSISNIVADLNTTVGTIQEVISFYTLVMASCMLLGAKMSDIIGKKNAFKYGLIIYSIGTLTAAFSVNVPMLALGWAIIEGIAAALMLPSVLSIIVNNYEGRDRAKAMSILSTVAAIALAVGPIIGGVVTTYLSWRYIFGGEMIIVILAFAFSGVIPKDTIKKEDRPKVDYIGFIFSGTGLFFIIFGLLSAKNCGWFFENNPLVIGGVTISLFGLSASFISIIIGLIVLFILLLWLKNQIKKGKPALFHPEIFINQIYTPSILVYFFAQMTFGGIMFCIPVFMQNALNYNAMYTGLSLMPLSIAVLLTSLFITKLVYRFSPKIVMIGGLLSILAGITIMRAQFWGDFSAITGTSFIIAFMFLGLGVGITFSIAYNLALSNVKPIWENEGAGLFTTIRNLGYSAGVAITGSVLFSSVYSNIEHGIINSNTSEVTGMTKTQLQDILGKNIDTFIETVEQGVDLSAEAVKQLEAILTDAMSISMDLVGLVLTVIIGIGLILAIFVLPNIKLKE